MEMRRLNIAIVGFGKMGMLHAGILNILPNVRLIAICEKSGFLRRFLKKIFRDTLIVDSVEKLSNVDLDAAYVTTPIRSHFPIVKSLYESGVTCNLFVEKTLASNSDEARMICNLARRYGGVNMVGYVRRFSATFMKAKSLLDMDIIGAPTYFKAYAYSSDFFGLENKSKVNAPRIDVIRELGCYALDLALWFFNDFGIKDVKVKSTVSSCSIDSAYFKAMTSDGIAGDFRVSWCMNGYRMPEVGFLIEGSGGSLSVNDDELTLSLKDGRSQKMFKHDLGDYCGFWLGSPEYYREDEQFIKAVTQKENAEPCFETAARVDALIDEILVRADWIEE